MSDEIHELKGNAKQHVEAFRMLMCAIHSSPFTIDTVETLEMATDMADYYRALPVLSIALYAAMINSPALLHEIPQRCIQLLKLSAKLRNAILFRECLIHICGPWNSPRYLTLPEGKLKQACKVAHGRLSSKILNTQKQFFEIMPSYPHLSQSFSDLIP